MCKFWRKRKSRSAVPVTVHTEVAHSIVVEEPPKDEVPKLKCLIGTSCYQAILYHTKAIEQFIEKIHAAGGNATEFFLCFTWQGGWNWQPYKLLPQTWTDPGFPDEFPIFDLDVPDTGIRAKWEAIFEACERYGVSPIVRIHDYCSLKNRWDKYHYCFRSNAQRFSGAMTGGLYGEGDRRGIFPYYEELNRWLVNALQTRVSIPAFIVVMNEADYLLTEEEERRLISEGKDPYHVRAEKIKEFHEWYIGNLMSHGFPASNIIISTSVAAEDMALWPQVIMEYHGCNSPETLRSQIRQYGNHGVIFPNGDGIDPLALGRAGDRPSKREPSVEQGFEMGVDLYGSVERTKKPVLGYCYFNRLIDVEGIKEAQFDVLAAMVQGYREAKTSWENHE